MHVLLLPLNSFAPQEAGFRYSHPVIVEMRGATVDGKRRFSHAVRMSSDISWRGDVALDYTVFNDVCEVRYSCGYSG